MGRRYTEIMEPDASGGGAIQRRGRACGNREGIVGRYGYEVCRDFGIDVDMHVLSDASAAIGMVMREGLGKVRHLAVADLWVQCKRDSKEIVYEKVDGLSNPADMLTKGVNGETIQKYSRVLGFRTKPGRHELMPRFMK